MVMTAQPALRHCSSAASTSARPTPPRRADASTASIPKYPVAPATRTSTAPSSRPSSSATSHDAALDQVANRRGRRPLASPELPLDLERGVDDAGDLLRF